MHPALQCFIVVLVFLGIYLFLILGIKFISKKNLYNIQGILLASITMGTIFSVASFILILISNKFQSWSFSSKLVYAGEIFLWVFLGSLVLIPIAFRRAQHYVQRKQEESH
jgi:hypothetical protein